MGKSPTLLCLFPLGSEVRQFGHSGLFDRLLNLGWRVVVAAKLLDDDLRAQMDPRVETVELPLDSLPFGLVHLTTGLLDRAHAERERRSGKTGWQYGKVVAHNWKQWLLYASQSASGTVLSFLPSAQRRLSARESAAIRKLPSSRCDEFLHSIGPDVVLLNVPRSNALLPLLSAAQAQRIPTVLLYHTWKDVVVLGRVNFPFARYGVWNESMRGELLRQNPWIDPRSVRLTGCAHFQCVGRQDLLLPEPEFRAALGATGDSRLVVFPASAPLMVPEEERYIRLLKSTLKSLALGRELQIVVRINPMDGDGRLAEVLRTDAPEVIVSKPDWRWDKKRNWCFQRRSDQVLYNSLLHYASVCVGMPSTVTVECAVADVPVINIGFDLPGPAPQPGGVRKFWDADFYSLVRKTKAAALGATPEDLLSHIGSALCDRGYLAEGRGSLINEQLGVSPQRSVDAALDLLASAAESTR